MGDREWEVQIIHRSFSCEGGLINSTEKVLVFMKTKKELEKERVISRKEKRLIDLYGYVQGFLHENANELCFVFLDDYYGELYCKAGSDTAFYFKDKPNQYYHLQVSLSGSPYETTKGKKLLRNQLYVKKVSPR